MRQHFPTFLKHLEKLPPSLFNPGAALWIIVGALVGFTAATGTMGVWVSAVFSDEVAAIIFVPAVIISVAGIGMAFGIVLHRAWDHKRAGGGVVEGGGEEEES